MPAPHVIVIGGGLAGLAASVALSDHGARVQLFERHPRLGGRATSYTLPDGETIDNCQHVTLRCCTNLEDFYRRIGSEKKIRFHERLLFADSSGRRAFLKASNLPAPLHLAPSFAFFPLLSWADKLSIARGMLRIIRSGGAPRSASDLSMFDWLKRAGQTRSAIDRFWRVVLVSALNEELDRTDARYGLAVFWKAFLSNRNGFGMGVPEVPLADLYASCATCIERNQGDVRTNCGVAGLLVDQGCVGGVRLENGTELSADYYIAAVPFDRLAKLLPAECRNDEAFAGLMNLHLSPIAGIHLWFDRQVMTEPFLTSLDHTIQWIFNKSSAGDYLQVVISASHALAKKPQQEIVEMCNRELRDLIPRTAAAQVVKSVVVRETSATFSPEPGCDRWRLPQRTSIRNLLLAGDWTETGWPATMEGAVRSGYLAAEAILGVPLVKPELPATGLARLFART